VNFVRAVAFSQARRVFSSMLKLAERFNESFVYGDLALIGGGDKLDCRSLDAGFSTKARTFNEPQL